MCVCINANIHLVKSISEISPVKVIVLMRRIKWQDRAGRGYRLRRYVLEKKSITFLLFSVVISLSLNFNFNVCRLQTMRIPGWRLLRISTSKNTAFLFYFLFLFCSLCVSSVCVHEIPHMMMAITLEPDQKKRRASPTINRHHHSCALGNNVVNYPDTFGIFPVRAVTGDRWHLYQVYSLFIVLIVLFSSLLFASYLYEIEWNLTLNASAWI